MLTQTPDLWRAQFSLLLLSLVKRPHLGLVFSSYGEEKTPGLSQAFFTSKGAKISLNLQDLVLYSEANQVVLGYSEIKMIWRLLPTLPVPSSLSVRVAF